MNFRRDVARLTYDIVKEWILGNGFDHVLPRMVFAIFFSSATSAVKSF